MGSKIERAIYARELIPHPKSAQPGKPLHCLGPGMSGLKPILKLGVPVRDRPPTTASVRPVRGPGAALFPEAFRSLCRTKLPTLACTHISPRTPRRLVDGPIGGSRKTLRASIASLGVDWTEAPHSSGGTAAEAADAPSSVPQVPQ